MPGVTTFVSVAPVVAFVTFVFQPDALIAFATVVALTKLVLASPVATETVPLLFTVVVKPDVFTGSAFAVMVTVDTLLSSVVVITSVVALLPDLNTTVSYGFTKSTASTEPFAAF